MIRSFMARHHQLCRFTGGLEPVITVEPTTARAWLITAARITGVQTGMRIAPRIRTEVTTTMHGVVRLLGATAREVQTDTVEVPLPGIMVPAMRQAIGLAPRHGATVPVVLRATRGARPLGVAAPDHGTDQEVVRAPLDAS